MVIRSGMPSRPRRVVCSISNWRPRKFMLPRDSQVPSAFRHVSEWPWGPAFERIVNRCAPAGALASDSAVGGFASTCEAASQTSVQIAPLINRRMKDPLAQDREDERTLGHFIELRHPRRVGRGILLAERREYQWVWPGAPIRGTSAQRPCLSRGIARWSHGT